MADAQGYGVRDSEYTVFVMATKEGSVKIRCFQKRRYDDIKKSLRVLKLSAGFTSCFKCLKRHNGIIEKIPMRKVGCKVFCLKAHKLSYSFSI